MNKNLLKNAWVLAGIAVGISFLVGWIILLLNRNFGVSNGLQIVAVIAAAMAVAQIYTANFKEIMPKKLRWHVAIIYVLADLVLNSLYLSFVGIELNALLLTAIVIIGSVFVFVVYWMLGIGGKTMMNTLEKQKK